MESANRIRILLYTRQPFTAQGLATVVLSHADLELAACQDTLAGTLDCLRSTRSDVLLVHLISGIRLADLREMRSADRCCQVVLWGEELGGEFAFQAMQLGVRGILPGNASIDDCLAALRNVHRGVLCFDRDLLENVLSQKRVALTLRQGQIVSLVAQGLKNKEIAFSLGLTEGTVKVYLYKLFKKLGMNDRLDMALFGLKNLFSGQPELERVKASGVASSLAGGAMPAGSLLLVARKQPGAHVVH